MRCENCKYSGETHFDNEYDSICFVGLDFEENDNGSVGCRFNKVTIEKYKRENDKYWEQVFEDINNEYSDYVSFENDFKKGE